MYQLPVQDCGKLGPVDDEVSHPVVAVHQNRGRRLGPAGGQPAKRPFEGGGAVAHGVEPLAPLHELILVGQAGNVRVGAVDGGQRLRALPQQPLAARVPIGFVEPTLDAPDDGLTLDFLADEKGIAQGRGRIVGEDNVGDRRSGSGGGGLGAGLELHAGVHIVGWAGAQDQRPVPVAGDGIECPRGSAGAPGECAQVFDGHGAGAEGRL